MNQAIVYKILSKHSRRGVILNSTLLTASASVAVIVLVTSQPWCVVLGALLSSIVFSTAAISARRRVQIAKDIACNPKVVFWVHAINRDGSFSKASLNDSHALKLHTRDGNDLEVICKSTHLVEVISWLLAHNTLLHLGSFDYDHSILLMRDAGKAPVISDSTSPDSECN